MPESPDFFLAGKTAEKLPQVKSWQMVTNHSNLYYQIAAGLLMPPEGFGSKYYLDTADAFPGHLPIFPVNVSQAAVDFSVSEKSHLIPCILNMDLNSLRGPVKVITPQGEVKDVNFPEEVDNSCQLMLVAAPLPINFISSIVCRSREEKLQMEKDAQDFSNVDISGFKIKAGAAAFAKNKADKWPPQDISIAPRGASLDVPMAAGAMMGVLSKMSNRGKLSISAGRLAFEPESSLPSIDSYPAIAAMGEWLQRGKCTETEDVSQRLFWNIVSQVSAAKRSADAGNVMDVAIAYLEDMPPEEFDQNTRSYGERLASDLRSILGLADSTISEIFERHPKPVSRAMTLFVLREKIEDLLEFDSAQLTEADYILAAILFAAREGWIGLANDLRDLPGLNAAVSHRMAAIAHTIAGSNLDLGQAPERPQSLIELLTAAESSMSSGQKEAALYIARQLKWACLQTQIDLGKGDYQLGVTGAGIRLTLDGDVKAVVTEVLEDDFMVKLLATEIPIKVERKVRELLRGAK
jgi:hypothetical protein